MRLKTPTTPRGSIWRPVVGYEGLYEVSDYGDVRRIADATGTEAGYIIKPQKVKNREYMQVRLCRSPSDHKSASLHSVVCEAFHGARPPGMQVNHKNGVPGDNRAENLEWVTPSQNTRHRFDVLKLGNKRGEEHPHARFTERDVLAIRARRLSGETCRAIAESLSCSVGAIKLISCRRNWKHI